MKKARLTLRKQAQFRALLPKRANKLKHLFNPDAIVVDRGVSVTPPSLILFDP